MATYNNFASFSSSSNNLFLYSSYGSPYFEQNFRKLDIIYGFNAIIDEHTLSK